MVFTVQPATSATKSTDHINMECELCSRLPTLQVNMGIALEIDCAKSEYIYFS